MSGKRSCALRARSGTAQRAGHDDAGEEQVDLDTALNDGKGAFSVHRLRDLVPQSARIAPPPWYRPVRRPSATNIVSVPRPRSWAGSRTRTSSFSKARGRYSFTVVPWPTSLYSVTWPPDCLAQTIDHAESPQAVCPDPPAGWWRRKALAAWATISRRHAAAGIGNRDNDVLTRADLRMAARMVSSR